MDQQRKSQNLLEATKFLLQASNKRADKNANQKIDQKIFIYGQQPPVTRVIFKVKTKKISDQSEFSSEISCDEKAKLQKNASFIQKNLQILNFKRIVVKIVQSSLKRGVRACYHPIPKKFNSIFELSNSMKSEIQYWEIYSKYLDLNIPLEMLNFFRKHFLTHEQSTQLFRLIISYMRQCNNDNQQWNQYIKQWAQKWLKLKFEVVFSNKDALRVLHYLHPTENCYLQLRFDLSIVELKKVARKAKQLSKYGMRAFFYISNYLEKACILKEQEGMSLREIQQLLVKSLNFLSKQHPPSKPFSAESTLVGVHSNYETPQSANYHKVIDLRASKGKRQQSLIAYIIEQAKKARQNYNSFVQCVRDVCLSQGYHFRSNLKIHDENDAKSIDRVREKILNGRFSRYTIKQYLSATQKGNIRDFLKCQQQHYISKMKLLCEGLDQPIPFKVKDLLRAKCMFSDLQKMNQCCTDLIIAIKNAGHILLRIDNRLQKNTADLVLNIKIGQAIAELQLAIDFKVVDNQFNHRFYELMRSNYLSPISALRKFNQSMSFDFVKLQQLYVLRNRQENPIILEEGLDYRTVENYLEKLANLLPFKPDLAKSHKLQPVIETLLPEISNYYSLRRQRKPFTDIVIQDKQKHYKNALFWLYSKEHLKAAAQLQAYLSQQPQIQDLIQQQIKQEVMEKLQDLTGKLIFLGNIYNQAAKYERSLEIYDQIRKIIPLLGLQKSETQLEVLRATAGLLIHLSQLQKAVNIYKQCLKLSVDINGSQFNRSFYAITLDIGNAYKGHNQYLQALSYYRQALKILKTLQNEQSFDFKYVFNCLGVIEFYLGHFSEAIKYYQKSLDIIETVKGKESIDYAQTLGNLAIVYQKKLDYQFALDAQLRCLEIIEAINGKGSFETAGVLNNIGILYYRQANYSHALQIFQKCLDIYATTKGIQSKQWGQIHNNIGAVYFDICRFQQAISEFNIYLSLFDTEEEDKISACTVRINIASACIQLGNFEQAFEQLLKVESLSKTTLSQNLQLLIQFHNTMGNYYIRTGQLTNAQENLRLAEQICGKISGGQSLSIPVLYQLGRLQIKRQSPEAAVTIFESLNSVIEKLQGDQSVNYMLSYLGLGLAYLMMQKYNISRQWFTKCIGCAQKYRKIYLQYAQACEGIGDIQFYECNYQKASKWFLSAQQVFESCREQSLAAVKEKRIKCAQNLKKI